MKRTACVGAKLAVRVAMVRMPSSFMVSLEGLEVSTIVLRTAYQNEDAATPFVESVNPIILLGPAPPVSPGQKQDN